MLVRWVVLRTWSEERALLVRAGPVGDAAWRSRGVTWDPNQPGRGDGWAGLRRPGRCRGERGWRRDQQLQSVGQRYPQGDTPHLGQPPYPQLGQPMQRARLGMD